MMRSLILGVMLAIAGAVHAGPPFFLDSGAGRFLVYESADGVPAIVPVDDVRVVVWDDESPPDNPDDTPEQLAKDVTRWAIAVGDTDDSQRYALIFATARDAVMSDKIKPADLFPVVGDAANRALKVDWSTFRDRLTDYSTAAKQEGKLGTKTQVVNFAAAVKHGLELSANGSDAISLDESIRVLAITNEAIDEVIGK